MLAISFDIQRVLTDEEARNVGVMDPIYALLHGDIVFGDSGLRFEKVPLLHAMSAFVRSVHILLFYSSEVVTDIDLRGSQAPMRRDGDVVEVHWGGAYRFGIVDLGRALGRGVVTLIDEIKTRRPEYGPGTPAFNSTGQELFDAVAGYKWPKDF